MPDTAAAHDREQIEAEARHYLQDVWLYMEGCASGLAPVPMEAEERTERALFADHLQLILARLAVRQALKADDAEAIEMLRAVMRDARKRIGDRKL